MRGLGNGRLLPAGPLREPASRLESVDIVVVHGGDPAADVAWRGREASIRMGLRLLDARPVSAVRADGDRGSGGVLRSRALKEFCGSPVHAVAGIGHPQRFFEALQAEGLQVVAHAFPDHHDFRPTDLDFGDAYPVLMTSKDAVKCRQFSNALLWEIPVQATIADHDAAGILGLVRALSGGR